MGNSLFCGGCGKSGMQPNWKHCPHCGFKILVPEVKCKLSGTPKESLPENWNPLFLRASDIADQLISEGFVQTKLELADPDWDQDWIEEFNHDHYRIAYLNDGEGQAKASIELVITGRPLEEMLKEKFSDLEDTQVRLLDDGWYIEVQSFESDWQADEAFAKILQENYGGEIVVAKPKKKK